MSHWLTHCLSTSGSLCLDLSLSLQLFCTLISVLICSHISSYFRGLSSPLLALTCMLAHWYLHWIRYQMPLILLCPLPWIMIRIHKTYNPPLLFSVRPISMPKYWYFYFIMYILPYVLTSTHPILVIRDMSGTLEGMSWNLEQTSTWIQGWAH